LELREAKKVEQARERIVRFMRTRTRLAAAARVRREREYLHGTVKARLARDALKIEALADMREAMCRARVDKMRTSRIGLDQWRSSTVLERTITPVGALHPLHPLRSPNCTRRRLSAATTPLPSAGPPACMLPEANLPFLSVTNFHVGRE
jgi:hypothetical protein